MKVEAAHYTTIMMISCLISASPYDLPSYMPALLTSFVRHVHSPSPLNETVTKAVQMFKRTHQDRWDNDYKDKFSREQLEDLQGAGAAHYFS